MQQQMMEVAIAKNGIPICAKKAPSTGYQHSVYYAHAPRVGALSDDARLTSVCLSRTLGLSQEQRGLGPRNTKIVTQVAHVTMTRTPLSMSKGQLAGGGGHCGLLRALHAAQPTVSKHQKQTWKHGTEDRQRSLQQLKLLTMRTKVEKKNIIIYTKKQT